MNDHLEAQARLAADRCDEVVGDQFSIIIMLLPLLIQLFKGCGGGAPSTPKEAADEHYDETTGEFDSHFVKSLRHQTRRAAKKAGTHLSKPELDAITVATLQQAREADDAAVAAIME